MASQIINISFPEELVKKIDAVAKANYATHSEFIRQSVVNRLQLKDNDVWDALAAGADELQLKAKRSGYTSDDDFIRAGKEVRKTKSKA